jgi:UDP-N-acetylglucosamine:LPS N-acetylglucosamine transferase
VVYSRVGGGHLSAARALATEFEATGRCRVRMVDAYVECGRFPVTRFPSLYAELARHHPLLWSLVYHGSSRGLNPNLIVGPFLRDGFRQLMTKEQPELVISVLPVINGLLAQAGEAVGARTEVVLTDWHSLHPFWVARGVDHYTASTESSRADCVRFGAPRDTVDVVGIPVRREFNASGSHPRLDQQRRCTVLAMVGAEGSPRAFTNIAELARANIDAELVVVCGRNDELRRQMERMNVKALGFLENVADLMRGSDILITKAGGLTLAEAFCTRIPVVIHDVLAGQEAGNLEYVLGKGAVEYAPSPQTLVRIVAQLIADPVRRAALSERAGRLGRPDAARVIVRNALERLDAAGA